MSSLMLANPKAELARAAAALELNIGAARGLADVMKSNLGPKGTLKMLVSGAGDVKLTKDGNVLLHEMSIQHPTATMIARASTAQDDITGDGTTSTVLLIGALLRHAEIQVQEGLHPRLITQGFELAQQRCLEVLDEVAVAKEMSRETLVDVARTSLRTKLHPTMADHLTECLVDAVLAIRKEGEPIDLHMVEIQEMQHQMELDTCLVKGLVLDHGARHPDMPKRSEKAFILTLNVSLEYEKTEINSGFFYKSSAEREALLKAERAHVEERCHKIVALKRAVVDEGKDPSRGFVVVNQKGIDPPCLEILAKAGIVAIRRAKRRNMERITLACGGTPLNSLDSMSKEDLGYAGLVYEHVLGEDKFTFIEELERPFSVTLLLKGPNKHTIVQTKDAVHDGLRAVKNAIEAGAVVAGAGAFEVAASVALGKLKEETKGRARLGVGAFAEALLVIPKTLATNAGLDPQEAIVNLTQEHQSSGILVGLDISTGEAMDAGAAGIWDNLIVKRNSISSAHVIASNLLLVDEVMRAGMSSLKG